MNASRFRRNVTGTSWNGILEVPPRVHEQGSAWVSGRRRARDDFEACAHQGVISRTAKAVRTGKQHQRSSTHPRAPFACLSLDGTLQAVSRVRKCAEGGEEVKDQLGPAGAVHVQGRVVLL